MPLGNKRNILVGASAVFLGPAGTTKPATVTRASFLSGAAQDNGPAQTFGTGSAVTDWRNVGYTQDGLEIASDPSYGEVEVDQLLDTPAMFKDGMSFSISTTFAEATLENLLIAWGQAASTLTSTASDKTLTIKGGALGEAPIERGLIAIGNAPKAAGQSTYRERVYHAFNVLSVEGSGHTMARAEATVIPVTFRAMPDDTSGDYGTIRDSLT
jgi:hypothetical protein